MNDLAALTKFLAALNVTQAQQKQPMSPHATAEYTREMRCNQITLACLNRYRVVVTDYTRIKFVN